MVFPNLDCPESDDRNQSTRFLRAKVPFVDEVPITYTVPPIFYGVSANSWICAPRNLKLQIAKLLVVHIYHRVGGRYLHLLSLLQELRDFEVTDPKITCWRI